jgi:hypothetical protein
MRIRSLVLAVLLVVLSAPSAWAIGKGTSMFAIQLTSGTADLIEPEAGTGYSTAFEHSEIGVSGEYWNMVAEDYAFTIAAGMGFFGETDAPGSNVGPGAPDVTYSQSSFNIRIGGDRVVKIGESAVVFFGPGFEYWSGSATFENIFGPGEVESESTTRYSLNARIGATMLLSETFGITMHGGQRIGHASAEDAGAKVTWAPSSFEAACGIVFAFGGN